MIKRKCLLTESQHPSQLHYTETGREHRENMIIIFNILEIKNISAYYKEENQN